MVVEDPTRMRDAADVDVDVGALEGPPRGDVPVDVPVDGASPVTFGELYADRFLPLVRLATLLTGRVDVARDVVQDAFVQLHVRWSSVRDPGAYVKRSVVNGCRSHHRRRARRRDVSLGEHDVAVGFEVDHTLVTLAVLNARERACVVLKFYEGRSEREIAELVGCRPGSVGPTVHRALEKLRAVQD